MTKVADRNALVLDGNTVKLRLMAERTESKRLVHVDWLRFTAKVKTYPPVLTDRRRETTSVWDEGYRLHKLLTIINGLPDADQSPAQQAADLAERVCTILGFDFVRHHELQKGHDFYKHRWSIKRNEEEVGWVGFGASSDSPRQRTQAETLHVNLYGKACTFADTGWTDKMANLVDELQAKITRVDLALDFFDGYAGGIERVWEDYKAGLCDHYGRRPKLRDLNWLQGNSRSLYIGSKEAGKETNVYEKGDQLFGPEADVDWLRFELRYGNKLRVIESEVLRRPQDFFAGASDWHAAVLREAGDKATPEPIQCKPREAIMSVQAECARNARWVLSTAAASVGVAATFLDEEQFLELIVSAVKRPSRLRGFSDADLRAGYASAFQSYVAPRSGPVAQGVH
ncbi:replication initiation factor domain-containing protein [Xenophilus azovorans]|uniref:replication initiation factor domain-containing protein n=1 Tax=Xenophilus azovorans TaxID=151755 RepID=UPI0006909250|nr:replication initiation factor domain-containing protein [Xenophilus azovorans]